MSVSSALAGQAVVLGVAALVLMIASLGEPWRGVWKFLKVLGWVILLFAFASGLASIWTGVAA